MPSSDQHLNLGFETAGNATLVCHDKQPLLVTDPWLEGGAYFGAWTRSHQVPPQVLDNITRCKYVWISHSHPDHLSLPSLERLRDKKILLPDHVGGRVRESLKGLAFDVVVLKDRHWYKLSDRVRIFCIADYNQDGILLTDMNGALIVNFNDAGDCGWGRLVRRIIRQYEVSFHLEIPRGIGDATTINLWREDGTFVEPRAARQRALGKLVARQAKVWGTRYFVPFSWHHTYQRADNIELNKYLPKLTDYEAGFESDSCKLLPSFVRFDLETHTYESHNPPENNIAVRDPSEFGDHWSDTLGAEDKEKLRRYFRSIGHLEGYLDFIGVRVGGQDHMIELGKRHFNRGLTFEAPRRSLMAAVENEVFDDILNGNFMKTTIHGKSPKLLLGPDFVPYVTKYADNGQAKSKEEVEAYFRSYMMRAPLDYLIHRIEKRATGLVRFSLQEDSRAYTMAARTYFWLKGARLSVQPQTRRVVWQDKKS